MVQFDIYSSSARLPHFACWQFTDERGIRPHIEPTAKRIKSNRKERTVCSQHPLPTLFPPPICGLFSGTVQPPIVGIRAACFFTPPRKFDLGRNRFNLTADAPTAYPRANSIAVLVYPYAPFTADERIPAYYIASNRAYHSAKKLAEALTAAGIHVEKTDIPVKMQLEAEGIGIKCRNSLIALPEFGTRIVLLTFAVREIPPETLSELLTVLPSLNTRQSECGNCSLCMKACPTGAISENGLTTERCMRLQMETAQRPDSVRAMQKTFIGCEICQYACPRNANVLARSIRRVFVRQTVTKSI